jgi:acetyl-CoA carboxylase, biotin carboxylase subunit
MFDTVLVANRGEIAVRVIRTLREMGIRSVAVFSDVDRASLHVRMADEAEHIGPSASAESYLRMDRILDAAKKHGAEAIHPGYGFLSENAEFAAACETAGLVFIGPSAGSIRAMGSKTAARRNAIQAGTPVVPGSESVASLEELKVFGEGCGYPILLKAVAGGGGKGMRVVGRASELEAAARDAASEAERSFGNPEIYAEKLIARPRHIEIQVLGDGKGEAIHLGERDCSLQRRHQKVWEEGPSPVLSAAARAKIGETCAKAMRDMKYLGVGTIEFLYEDGEFYFIEMNTRIQVEHPVTESITDIDLVLEQIRIAAGGDLPAKQDEVAIIGHAIECRINAENPQTFRPSPGRINQFHPPGGLGVRIDSAVYQGYVIPPYYDSLVGKLIVHGKTRQECLMRLRRALDEMVVDGIETTLPLFRALVREKSIIDGDYHIHWLEQYLAGEPPVG